MPPPPYGGPPKDRRVLYGVLIFFGLILLCFAFVVSLSSDRSAVDETGPQIGVVEVDGPIVGSHQALTALRKFRKNDKIKAILVRINSPGGAVGPSQEIYRELKRLKKPVVASMETVAASGGYYIAAGANKIVANRGTITGSIGVISQTTNLAELLELARIRTSTFKTGKYKDTGSPLRAMDDEERAYMQKFVDKLLAQFVSDVAKGRGLDIARVKAVADGRLLTGEEAKAAGLVDELGNFNDALELAAKLAGAKGDPVPVYHRSRMNLLQELLQEPASEALQSLQEALRERQRVEARAPRL